MAIKRSVQLGNPVIRRRAKAVKDFRSVITKRTVRDLIDSMRHHDLVGMAAPQIGVGLRIFVTEIRKTKNRSPKAVDPLRVFINPKITFLSEQKVLGYEGCGSVASADLFGEVKRSKSVVIQASDLKGNKFTLKATNLLARVIQHEFDHIEGEVFLDRKPHIKSFMSGEEYRKKFKK